MAIEAADAWERWYAEWGRRAITTRDWHSDARFFASGGRDLEAITHRFSLPTSGRCHEIGCGSGRMTVHLARHFGALSANDICGSAVKDARSLVGSAASITVGGPEALHNLPDGQYDLVVSLAVLQHVNDTATILAYITQSTLLLAAGGVAALEVASSGVHRFLHDLAVDACRAGRGALSGRSKTALSGTHWRGSTPPRSAIQQAVSVSGVPNVSVSVAGGRLTDWVLVRRSSIL